MICALSRLFTHLLPMRPWWLWKYCQFANSLPSGGGGDAGGKIVTRAIFDLSPQQKSLVRISFLLAFRSFTFVKCGVVPLWHGGTALTVWGSDNAGDVLDHLGKVWCSARCRVTRAGRGAPVCKYRVRSCQLYRLVRLDLHTRPCTPPPTPASQQGNCWEQLDAIK